MTKKFLDISIMIALQVDERVYEMKGLPILTSKKILTKPPVSLAQIKARNNS